MPDPMAPRPESLTEFREHATRRLLSLDQRGELTSAHVRLVAECLGAHERTVWRWLQRARLEGECGRKVRARFVISDELRAWLALLGGNIARLHRELRDQERAGGPAAPSQRTLYRAFERDLTPGDLAGIRKGEAARRAFDAYLRRPDQTETGVAHRNLVWEGDHVMMPVHVDVDGSLCSPWVTWFIDCFTEGICGVAVTPSSPSRESILAALRSAIRRDDRYGPFGGLPRTVRIDQGNDFLSKTVTAALGQFAVPVVPMPGYHPYLKGSVEELNGAVKTMFCKSLPRYTHGPKLLGGKPVDPDEPALSFEGFVELLLDWVDEWNRVLPKVDLDNRTPEQVWLADAWPLDDVPVEHLRLMMLEDDGRDRMITTKGVRWRNRHYVGPWMQGMVGRRVRLRHMPHHDHEIEVFDAATGRHLGSAFVSDQATDDQRRAVLAARRAKAKRLKDTLKAAARRRRVRYAAVTVPEPARVVGALTAAEADAELQGVYRDRLRSVSRPDLFPLPEAGPGWVVPGSVSARDDDPVGRVAGDPGAVGGDGG